LLKEAGQWLGGLTSEVLNLITKLAVKTLLEINDVKVSWIWHVCDVLTIVSLSQQGVEFREVLGTLK